jgi:hypothetical protein
LLAEPRLAGSGIAEKISNAVDSIQLPDADADPNAGMAASKGCTVGVTSEAIRSVLQRFRQDVNTQAGWRSRSWVSRCASVKINPVWTDRWKFYESARFGRASDMKFTPPFKVTGNVIDRWLQGSATLRTYFRCRSDWNWLQPTDNSLL